MQQDKYSAGYHPNSMATRFSSTNQPENRGRKKGTRNWDSVFRKLNNSKAFADIFMKDLPSQWNEVLEKRPAEVIAAAFIISTTREALKAIQNDKPLSKDVRDAIMQLNKLGYGDKVVIEPEASVFDKVNLNFNVVQSARTEDKLNGESK